MSVSSSITLYRRDGDVIGTGKTIKDVIAGGRADLLGADLQGADLQGADLRGSNLRVSYLRGANLQGANLGGANLRDANLGGANLRDANLGGANLRDADLRDANLGGANLRGADLRGANLWGATIVPAVPDKRGFTFYVTWEKGAKLPEPIIRAGCQRWETFVEAREHYGDEYGGDGDRAECLAILDFMELRFKALTAGASQ